MKNVLLFVFMLFHSLFQLFDFRIFPKNSLRLDGFEFFKRNCLHKENVKNNVFALNCKTNTFRQQKRSAISLIVCELRKVKINGTCVANGIKSVPISGGKLRTTGQSTYGLYTKIN